MLSDLSKQDGSNQNEDASILASQWNGAGKNENSSTSTVAKTLLAENFAASNSLNTKVASAVSPGELSSNFDQISSYSNVTSNNITYNPTKNPWSDITTSMYSVNNPQASSGGFFTEDNSPWVNAVSTCSSAFPAHQQNSEESTSRSEAATTSLFQQPENRSSLSNSSLLPAMAGSDGSNIQQPMLKQPHNEHSTSKTAQNLISRSPFEATSSNVNMNRSNRLNNDTIFGHRSQENVSSNELNVKKFTNLQTLHGGVVENNNYLAANGSGMQNSLSVTPQPHPGASSAAGGGGVGHMSPFAPSFIPGTYQQAPSHQVNNGSQNQLLQNSLLNAALLSSLMQSNLHQNQQPNWTSVLNPSNNMTSLSGQSMNALQATLGLQMQNVLSNNSSNNPFLKGSTGPASSVNTLAAALLAGQTPPLFQQQHANETESNSSDTVVSSSSSTGTVRLITPPIGSSHGAKTSRLDANESTTASYPGKNTSVQITNCSAFVSPIPVTDNVTSDFIKTEPEIQSSIKRFSNGNPNQAAATLPAKEAAFSENVFNKNNVVHGETPTTSKAAIEEADSEEKVGLASGEVGARLKIARSHFSDLCNVFAPVDVMYVFTQSRNTSVLPEKQELAAMIVNLSRQGDAYKNFVNYFSSLTHVFPFDEFKQEIIENFLLEDYTQEMEFLRKLFIKADKRASTAAT